MRTHKTSLLNILFDWPMAAGTVPFVSSRGFGARLRCCAITIAVSLAALSAQYADASEYYDYKILARTGQAGLVGVKTAPSINNAGNVGFIGLVAGGEGVFFADGQNVVNLSPDHASRTFSPSFQMNDFNTVVARDSFGGIFNIRFWFADAPGSFTDVDSTTGIRQSYCTGGTFAGRPCSSFANCPDLFVPGLFYPCSQPPQSRYVGLLFPTINNRSHVAYIGGLTGTTSNVLAFRDQNSPQEYRLLGGYNTMRTPALADDGRIVARAGNSSSSPILLLEPNFVSAAEIVSSANGFTSIGQLPGISDDGSIVAFAANRGSGTGVFVSFEASPGNRVIVRVAGENQGSPRPELGYDNQAQPLYFSSLDLDNRISVIRDELGAAGLEGDNVVVCFTATPNAASRTTDFDGLKFNANRGLWSIRLNVAGSAANPNVLEFTPINPLPVMQIGDSLSTPAGDRVIDNFSSFDALASIRNPTETTTELPRLGDHRIAFWASSGADQFIVGGDPCVVRKGVDISRFQGEPSPSWFHALKQEEYEFVIVQGWSGVVRNSHAPIQLRRGREAGLLVAAYCFLHYADIRDGACQVREAIRACGDEAANLGFVAVDVEFLPEFPNYYPPGLRDTPPDPEEQARAVQRIGEAVMEIERIGLKPIIYSNRSYWQQITGNTVGFRDLPLWHTTNDGDPSLATRRPNFGGWSENDGKQYAVDLASNPVVFNGVSVDFNAFRLCRFRRGNSQFKFPQTNLGFLRVGSRIVLCWDDPGTVLEQAPTVGGPWTPLSGQQSPYEIDISHSTASGFFRLRVE